jgi:hypothetical protein
MSSRLRYCFLALWLSAAALGVGCGPEMTEGTDSDALAAGDAVTAADLAFYGREPAQQAADPSAAITDGALTVDSSSSHPTRGDKAVVWYQDHRGSSSYEGLCELAVERSFGTRGRFPTAAAHWAWQVNHGHAHRGDTDVPRGAVMFWDTSANHHVAVSDGAGGEWSTSVNGAIGHAKRRYFSNYLGWAWAPSSWPGR